MSTARNRPPHHRCMVCSPTDCHRHSIYVVIDGRRGLVKIGMSRDPRRRLATYRANGADHFRLHHVQVAGCEFTARHREAKAIRLLARVAQRVQGDWFDATTGTAMSCVAEACAGYRGEGWS